MPNVSNLDMMMNPRSVAIIGASKNPDKVGHVILQNYVNAGYSGRLYPVNKDADEIMGLKAYARVGDIKDRIDLAVIAVPAKFVPGVLEECGKAGVRSTVVVSGGFAEIGQVKLQEDLVRVAKKYNMPTLGPNCLGVMDPRSRVDTLFLPTFKLIITGLRASSCIHSFFFSIVDTFSTSFSISFSRLPPPCS